jgi:hypothetical protein
MDWTKVFGDFWEAVAVAAPYIRTPPELRHSDPTSDRMSDPY